MIDIKRFASFADVKEVWKTLESTSFHYPFQSWWYNNLFTQHFSSEADLYILGMYENTQLLAIGVFEIIDNTVTLLGTKDVSKDPKVVQDITDFADLTYSEKGTYQAQAIWDAIFSYFADKNLTALNLNYVRQDSPTYEVLRNQAAFQQTETSPFITLPASWDDYLATLDRKERHELKRKIKRLEQDTAFHFCKDQTIQTDFNEFVRLHRLSDPNKAIFMTKDMEKFFWDLVTCEKEDWEIHFCSLHIDEKQVASVMTLMNGTYTLLYNSGFDPEYSYYSVGLLVKAFLLKKSIEQGKKIYDFLRGNERYKYDLGAKDMPLFAIKK